MKPGRPLILITAAYPSEFRREIFHGMMTYAHQHTNWRLMCRVDLPLAEQRKLQPAGVLSVGPYKPARKRPQQADTASPPTVMVTEPLPGLLGSTVSVDEQGVGAMGAEHFIGLGFKHLAYVGVGDWMFVHRRRDGFIKAAESQGLGPVPQLLAALRTSLQRARFDGNLRLLLEALPRPCGVMATYDELGVQIIQTCRELGLAVPNDIAVLGVDNDCLSCELSDVPLSSIAQPLPALGYEAARLLHQHLDGETAYPAHRVLPPLRVVPRASSDLIALEDEDVVAALRLINDHFAEPINVTWIVGQLPVAQRTLYNKFQKLVGRTVLEQLHHVRFQKARELLSESDLSLGMVARRSGFGDQPWLTNSFRRELGITPNRFRQRFRPHS
jgi:LacI family transcriptional regulator